MKKPANGERVRKRARVDIKHLLGMLVERSEAMHGFAAESRRSRKDMHERQNQLESNQRAMQEQIGKVADNLATQHSALSEKLDGVIDTQNKIVARTTEIEQYLMRWRWVALGVAIGALALGAAINPSLVTLLRLAIGI